MPDRQASVVLESGERTRSEDALVAAAQSGDHAAFENLYHCYQRDVAALCSRWLSDPHAIEDVTQETFLRAFRHIGDFERGRPLWPWIATIAKRLCIDEQRGTMRRAVLGRSIHVTGVAPYDSTSEEALDRVDRQRLGRVLSGALDALRPRDRRVFVLQTMEGWSHEEIARRHGMSVHAVRNLAWRARHALRRSLRSERVLHGSWLLPAWLRSVRRRTLQRGWRLRSWMNARLESIAVDGAATIVFGVAALGVTLLAPHGTHGAPPVGGAPHIARREAGRATPAAGAPHAVPRATDRARSIAPRASVVSASLSIRGSDGGSAAPSQATSYVAVRSPDGRTLAWYEHGVRCGGQGDNILPRSGPVTIVC